MWSFGEFELDPERFQLSRCGAPVPLEPQALSLLIHLVRNRDRMVSKDEIVAAVWGGQAVSDASISSRVRSVRQGVGDDGARQGVIQTVHGRGFRFVAEVRPVPSWLAMNRNGVCAPAEHAAGRPSIAVLPLQPLAMAPELAILGEAIPHEIIQSLSRLRWIAVIARGSAFRFRRGAPDPDRVSAALAARYVLSGVVESLNRSVAVILELTDTHSSEIVWADRLTSPLEGLDELRARIVALVVSALDTHVPANEARIARLKAPEGIDAWGHYHLGLNHLYRFTAQDTALAKACFERAVAADRGFGRAHSGLSFTSFLEAFLRLTSDSTKAANAARRHAERSLELDPLDPFANFTMGRSFWLTNEPETAADWLGRATLLNPNYAQGFYASAFTSMLTGDAPATFAALDTSLRLSPLDPLLYGVHGVRAQMLIQQGDDATAAQWADRAASSPGAHYLIAMIALAANGLAGRHEHAQRWCREVRRLKPNATAEDYFAAFPTRNLECRARVAAELRRHGF